MVQVTKNLLTRDSYEALLAYRATPLETDLAQPSYVWQGDYASPFQLPHLK